MNHHPSFADHRLLAFTIRAIARRFVMYVQRLSKWNVQGNETCFLHMCTAIQ